MRWKQKKITFRKREKIRKCALVPMSRRTSSPSSLSLFLFIHFFFFSHFFWIDRVWTNYALKYPILFSFSLFGYLWFRIKNREIESQKKLRNRKRERNWKKGLLDSKSEQLQIVAWSMNPILRFASLIGWAYFLLSFSLSPF